MHRRALLSYGLGSFVYHNLKWISRHFFRPVALLPLGLSSLYALGILQLIIHRCKAFLVATVEQIWACSTDLPRRFYVVH